jgi:plastocyanin
MKQNLAWQHAGMLIGLFLAGAVCLRAATHFVGVTDSGFSPGSLTIAQGDEVVWVNLDGELHTTTSNLGPLDPNYWHGLLLDEDDTFSKVFNKIGEFTYLDQFTANSGLINVTAGVSTEIILKTPRWENDSLLFEVTGLTPGRFVVLEASTNLTSWTGLSTNSITTVPVAFTNAANTAPAFFRVYETETP